MMNTRRSKYDSIKELVKKTARVEHTCHACNRIIQKGESYYKEDIGRINKPGIVLRNFCSSCYHEKNQSKN